MESLLTLTEADFDGDDGDESGGKEGGVRGGGGVEGVLQELEEIVGMCVCVCAWGCGCVCVCVLISNASMEYVYTPFE